MSVLDRLHYVQLLSDMKLISKEQVRKRFKAIDDIYLGMYPENPPPTEYPLFKMMRERNS